VEPRIHSRVGIRRGKGAPHVCATQGSDRAGRGEEELARGARPLESLKGLDSLDRTYFWLFVCAPPLARDNRRVGSLPARSSCRQLIQCLPRSRVCRGPFLSFLHGGHAGSSRSQVRHLWQTIRSTRSHMRVSTKTTSIVGYSVVSHLTRKKKRGGSNSHSD
jgi:hypothetical protein